MCGVPYKRDYQKIFEDVVLELKKGFIKMNDALMNVGAGIKKDCFYSHITAEQKAIINELAIKNKNDHHRTGKVYLGKPCPLGHEYNNTGHSLRYVSNSACTVCAYFREGKLKANKDLRISKTDLLTEHPLGSENHYLGRLCKHNHKYYGHNYSVRFKCNNSCIICHKEKLNLDKIENKIGRSISRGIRKSLKDGKNGRHWECLVDYTVAQLKRHLESHFNLYMNWENYGDYWHIDHLIPMSHFHYTSTTDDDFHKCWALDNLRPLEAYINLKKGNRREKKYGNMSRT